MHARKENRETKPPKELEPGEQEREREREMSTKETLIDIKFLLKKIIAKPAPERKYSSKTTPRKKNTTQMQRQQHKCRRLQLKLVCREKH
jgi:hypothetical protein